MTLRRPSRATKSGLTWMAVALSVGLAAGNFVLAAHWSEPAHAKNGNAGGGNSGANAGGGNDNAGGNSAGHSNAGGNGKGKGASAASGSGAGPAITASDTALDLRTSGQIKPLAELYTVAEQQFGGEIVDAKLMGDETSGWTYDVRVVTEDGRVREVTYGAASLAVIAIDGRPVQ